MLIDNSALVEGLLGSISDKNRWCITTFATIAVIGLTGSNFIPVQTGRAADESDHENGEEEEEEEVQVHQDELVAMEEAAPPVVATSADGQKTRRKNSIAHEDIESGNVVYIDTDLEDINSTDVIQLSAVVSDVNGVIKGTFNEFVKPPDDAEWDPNHCDAHKIEKNDPRIANADSIKEVWVKYVGFVEGVLDGGSKVGMIRGWNGKGSEMTKFFKICHVLYRGELSMPRWVKYFCDPQKCISHYKGCKLHESKRKSQRVGYGLGTTYAEAFDTNFVGEHDALNDSKAQQKLCNHPHVKPYLDKSVSVELIDDIWKGKQARQAVVDEEPSRALPLGWDDSPATTYPIPADLKYTGANGGGVCGPTSQVTDACTNRNLADLFLFFFTIPILTTIAREMNRYGNETFVREVTKDEWREHALTIDEESGSDDDNENKQRKADTVRAIHAC